jgi:putative ABC transport system permease protein
MLVRWKTTLTTASTFTLVVAGLVMMFAFVNGVLHVCRVSGETDNVIVLQDGITDEVFSRIDAYTAGQVESVKGVSTAAQGGPLCSRELFLVVSDRDRRTGQYFFRQVRGVLPAALEVHGRVNLVRGTNLRHHREEVIVGAKLARDQQLGVGSELRIGDRQWSVVGIFEAGGGVFETEIWCDLNRLADQFDRSGEYTTLVLKTSGPSEAVSLAERVRDRFRNRIVVDVETEYYRRQTEQIEMLRTGAMLIAGLMSLGAVFAVMNTMFAAIRHRQQDIATLRILGFSRGEILACFIIESSLIACIGGVVGSSVGLAVNNVTLSTPLGFKDLEFAFRVDATTMVAGIGLALALGILGGLLPALTAMRVSPLECLRQ